MEAIKMRSKGIDRNKMVEYKKRIDIHKKYIDDIDNTVEKAKTNDVVKDKTTEVAKDETNKKITTNKRKKVAKKKPSKEFMEEIKRRAEEKAYKGIVSEEEELHEKEPKYDINKKERAERFKRLHDLAVQMSNKWKTENNNLLPKDEI